MRHELLPRPAARTDTREDGTRGPLLLFVHGIWHGAWCWKGRRIVSDDPEPGFREYFAARQYRTELLDLPGRGTDGDHASPRWTSIKTFADAVEDMVRQLGGDVVLVGHSMGTHVIQEYLGRPADRCPAAGAVLLAPVPPSGVRTLMLRLLRSSAYRTTVFECLTRARVWPPVATPALAHELLFSAAMPHAEVERYHRLLQDDSFRAFVDMLRLNRPNPARVRARRPSLPVLILGGSEDHIFTPEEVQATARAYDVEPRMFETAHDMMLDPAWQEVAEAIATWLDTLPPTPAHDAAPN